MTIKKGKKFNFNLRSKKFNLAGSGESESLFTLKNILIALAVMGVIFGIVFGLIKMIGNQGSKIEDLTSSADRLEFEQVDNKVITGSQVINFAKLAEKSGKTAIVTTKDGTSVYGCTIVTGDYTAGTGPNYSAMYTAATPKVAAAVSKAVLKGVQANSVNVYTLTEATGALASGGGGGTSTAIAGTISCAPDGKYYILQNPAQLREGNWHEASQFINRKGTNTYINTSDKFEARVVYESDSAIPVGAFFVQIQK